MTHQEVQDGSEGSGHLEKERWGVAPCHNMLKGLRLQLSILGEMSKEGHPTPLSSRMPKVYNLVTKLHMVTAWTNHLDERATGHSARRSGAMAYARKGMPIQSIQLLGQWKSSAVFRYVEDAMTEVREPLAPSRKRITTSASRSGRNGKHPRNDLQKQHSKFRRKRSPS